MFDNYNYPHNIPSKNRLESYVERTINNLDQELPPVSEWSDFLKNSFNKFQVATLLADYILSGALPGKNVYVNKESECYYKSTTGSPVRFINLDSNHREADQKIPMHAVVAGKSTDNVICVVADDSDIYLSLLYVIRSKERYIFVRENRLIKLASHIMMFDLLPTSWGEKFVT